MKKIMLILIFFVTTRCNAQISDFWSANNFMSSRLKTIATYEYFPTPNGRTFYKAVISDYSNGEKMAETIKWDTTKMEGNTIISYLYNNRRLIFKNEAPYGYPADRRTFSYSKHLNIIEMVEKDAKGKEVFRETTTRDDGREVERISGYTNDTVKHRSTYEYDKDGKLVKEQRDFDYMFDGSNSPYIRLFTYNDRGSIIQCLEFFHPTDTVKHEFSYESYDSAGNRTTMNVRTNGRLTEVIERRITYN